MAPGPMHGFRDYLPPDAGARSELRLRMRRAARRSGFAEFEGPSVEPLELYTRKSGEEIGQQVWRFDDKAGRPVALTPESTPTLARVLADRAKSEPLPVKWFTLARLWRYEEPQAGRTREFAQLNLDILGVPGVEADVEVLATAAAVLDEVGAGGLYAFRVSDRAILEAIARRHGLADTTDFLRAVDRFRKAAPPDFEAGLARSGIPATDARALAAFFRETGAGAPIGEAAEPLLARLEALGLDGDGRAGIDRLRRLGVLAEAAGLADRVRIDPTIARGIAYYTSTVYEGFALSGDGRALFGGGRYDRLIGLFGGPETPACGLAIGDQTLEHLLRAHGRWPEGEPAIDTFVIAVRPEDRPAAVRWATFLRARGRSADWDLLGRSLPRQMREAGRRRARRAWILGLKEAAPGSIVERDLATGAQREFPPDEAGRWA
ncbi:MAG: histidine--tRNA ligase [Thermoplasmata archaeon]